MLRLLLKAKGGGDACEGNAKALLQFITQGVGLGEEQVRIQVKNLRLWRNLADDMHDDDAFRPETGGHREFVSIGMRRPGDDLMRVAALKVFREQMEFFKIGECAHTSLR